MRTIILAGGCFWGVEAYFKQLKGVVDTSVGYIDGKKRNPTYKEVCDGYVGHTEACEVVYDEHIITFEGVLDHYFRIINPYTINKQGNDIGRQYRTGIYYLDPLDEVRAIDFIKNRFKDDYDRVQVKVKPALDYDLAETYHQDYLDKNPYGYCHVNLGLATSEEKK